MVCAAACASAGGWAGLMLNCHIFAPACSRNPWRMVVPFFFDNFYVRASEDYCASCVAESAHAEQVVGERAHDVTVFGSRR